MELAELKQIWTVSVTAAWCAELQAGGPLTEAQITKVADIASRVFDALYEAWLHGAKCVAGEVLEMLAQHQSAEDDYAKLLKFFPL